MSVTVVGSIAYDRVKTPFGERERMLGGAATHFALAASFFDEVRVVGPVGDDFADEDLRTLQIRGTSTEDVERVAGGKTVFWHRENGWGLNSPQARDPHLGLLGQFQANTSAGGRVGYLAARGGDLDEDALRRAMAYGTALASFNVEEFGTGRVARLTADEIAERVGDLQRITHFDDAPVELRT